jgi:hypothetical protein
MFPWRPSTTLSTVMICMFLAMPVLGIGAQSLPSKGASKSNTAREQEIFRIRARIQQCIEELSWNRSVQLRSDISVDDRLQLLKQETALTAEILNLQVRERALQ